MEDATKRLSIIITLNKTPGKACSRLWCLCWEWGSHYGKESPPQVVTVGGEHSVPGISSTSLIGEVGVKYIPVSGKSDDPDICRFYANNAMLQFAYLICIGLICISSLFNEQVVFIFHSCSLMQ